MFFAAFFSLEGIKIIHADDVVGFGKKTVEGVGADEAGAAGEDYRLGDGVRVFSSSFYRLRRDSSLKFEFENFLTA